MALLLRDTRSQWIVAVVILQLIWLVRLWGGGRITSTTIIASIHQNTDTYTQEEFIEVVTQKPVLHDLLPQATRQYCAQQNWPEDLVYRCHGIIGGIGSVRQQIFTCVRWAMASGAAILIPRPYARWQTNSTLGEEVKHRYGGQVEFDHFFDTEAFRATLKLICPQMRLYEESELGENRTIEDIGEFKLPPITSWNENLYQATSRNFLSQHGPVPKDHVRLAWLGRHMKESVICYDGLDFANSLGHLLQTRQDIMRLAALVLHAISTRFKININTNDFLAPGSFVGIHLRTSSDAVASGWMSFEKQAELYQMYLEMQPVPVIYVASGNLTSIQIFAQMVEPIPVVDKFSLLPPEEIAILKTMTWDQQGQVDYIVLTRVSLFLGMADSLFSQNVASSRRAASKNGTCGVSLADGNNIYNDGLTIVVGKSRAANQDPRYFWP